MSQQELLLDNLDDCIRRVEEKTVVVGRSVANGTPQYAGSKLDIALAALELAEAARIFVSQTQPTG